MLVTINRQPYLKYSSIFHMFIEYIRVFGEKYMSVYAVSTRNLMPAVHHLLLTIKLESKIETWNGYPFFSEKYLKNVTSLVAVLLSKISAVHLKWRESF